MPATLEVESTLTDRYQTTVPETVRRALRLGKRDKLHYVIRSNGEVVLTRAAAALDDDPVLGQFLAFLSKGFANKEIADKLQISVPTVRTHLRHIYEKLHVRCRTEAAAKYLGNPILAPRPSAPGP